MKNYKANKSTSEFLKGVHASAKQDHCILCGKRIDSTCNSHVVPKFVLKEIAEDGMISYGHIFHKLKVPWVEKTTGINNAYTFRLICKDCDKKVFRDYENPENILNFDSFSPQLQKQILCQMSLKAHLSHCQTKYNRLISKDIATGGKAHELEEQGILTPERIDLIEHFEYIDAIRKSEKTNKNPFRILYNNLLNYKTDFATQTVICFIYDLKGRKIFDPNNLSLDNKCSYFYLMILPVKNHTRILFYTEEKWTWRVETLIKQFEDLSEDDKLHFLFVSLIVHDQEFYVRPSKAKEIIKNDKKLIRLYSCTDQRFYWPFDNRKKIAKFKKYNNYLLERTLK